MNTHTEYLLHLADNALILGQKNAEWCGHGPILEEDIALSNISLDLIGQARLLYQHAAQLIGNETNEDQLAYWRDEHAFRNYTLLELPHNQPLSAYGRTDRDYAVTIVRNFLYSSLMVLLWKALESSQDSALAGIAAKSLKESRYHLRHASDWLLRLGDGTHTSHLRTQAALDFLYPYTREFWTESPYEIEMHSAHIGILTHTLKDAWLRLTQPIIAEATLQIPETKGYIPEGKFGRHSEHLGYVLAEMQCITRAHPHAQW